MMRSRFHLALVGTILALAVSTSAQTQEKQTPNPAKAPPKESKSASPKVVQKPSVPNPFEGFKQFSAIVNGGLANDNDRKVYRSGNLMRFDFDDSYRITNLDTLTDTGVKAGTCAKFAFPDVSSYPFSAYKGAVVVREPTDEKEVVDGHDCTIENVTFTTAESSTVVRMKLWEATNLDGFPIRIEVELSTGHKLTPLTYTDVKLERPDPKLFEIPARCEPGPAPGQKATVKVDPGKPAPKRPPKP